MNPHEAVLDFEIEEEEVAEELPRRRSPARDTLRRLMRHRLFVSGLCLFGIIALAAALAPVIAPVDPTKLAMRYKFRAPDADFLFGTDNFGRSLWSRVIWGAQLSVFIGASVVFLNAVFGTLVGALAGYFRRLDNALMRVNDAMMAFPAILLALGITAILGPSLIDAILALAIVYIPRTARIVRSSVIVEGGGGVLGPARGGGGRGRKEKGGAGLGGGDTKGGGGGF